MKHDDELLRMALIGYLAQRAEIDGRIVEIQKQIGGKGASSTAAAPAERTKRVLSPAARKRIAEAQKKRWAEHRKTHAKTMAAGG